MKSSTPRLPLLPVSDGFAALRRGLIHDHPSSAWLGALAHFDVDLPPVQLRAQLAGLLTYAAFHARHKELMMLGDWMLDQLSTRIRIDPAPALRRSFAQVYQMVRLPDQVLDWAIARLYANRPERLWTTPISSIPVTSKLQLGDTFLATSHRSQAIRSQAMKLLARLAQRPASALQAIPWKRQACVDNQSHFCLPDVEIYGRLVALAPPVAWPHLEDAFCKLINQDSLGGSYWPWARTLVHRLLPSLDLTRPDRQAVLALIARDHVALPNDDLTPFMRHCLIDQIAAKPAVQSRLLECIDPLVRDELKRDIDSHRLGQRFGSTAPTVKKCPRF